eukprot:bmy_07847T0
MGQLACWLGCLWIITLLLAVPTHCVPGPHSGSPGHLCQAHTQHRQRPKRGGGALRAVPAAARDRPPPTPSVMPPRPVWLACCGPLISGPQGLL